jgi:hydroxymethylpyrimidine/phosphomethylpyrimidine kinase
MGDPRAPARTACGRGRAAFPAVGGLRAWQRPRASIILAAVIPVALTIAGSDSSGGAGIQADLLTFAAFGVHGASVVTALTAQNTSGIRAVLEVEPGFVAQQIDAVLDYLEVRAAKTGMLYRAAVVAALAERLHARPLPHLVVDPVLAATTGLSLAEPAAIATLRDRLLPLATLVTPNLHEAEVLTGRPVTARADMREAARALLALGARAALVTGGHLAGDAVDVLYDGRAFREFSAPRVETCSTHGTGCVLSAAVTAGLALGRGLEEAVAAAKRHVTQALATAPGIGHGRGPLNLRYRSIA